MHDFIYSIMDTSGVMLQAPEFSPCLLPTWPLSCIEPETVLTASTSLAIQNVVCWACYPKNTQLDIWVVLSSSAGCQEHPSGKKWSRFKTYTEDKKQPKRELWRAPKSPNVRKFTWPLTEILSWQRSASQPRRQSQRRPPHETAPPPRLPAVLVPSLPGPGPQRAIGDNCQPCAPAWPPRAATQRLFSPISASPRLHIPVFSLIFLPSTVNAPTYTDPPTGKHIHE